MTNNKEKAFARSDQPQLRAGEADPRGDEKANSMRSETCICAAVLLPDGRKVFGHRHWDAMQTARDLGFTELVTQRMQGFITTRGRFVDRVEGLALQEAAGIASARGFYNGRALFSEDLY